MSVKVLCTWLGTAILLLGAVACGLEEEGPPVNPPSSKYDGSVGSPDVTTEPMAAPTVDPLPNSACTDSIPVQGLTVAGASVIVRGGSESARSADAHPLTGRFCVDVPLVKNTLNQLQVQATLPERGISNPVDVSITQSGSCSTEDPATPTTPESTNRAASAPVEFGGGNITEGTAKNMTDGDANTFTKLEGGDAITDPTIWVRVNLGKPYTIKKVVLNWKDGLTTGGNGYAKCYRVVVSQASDPGDPTSNNSNWSEIANLCDGNGNEDVHQLTTTTVAQYVAVIMTQNGGWDVWSEWFLLSEFEVWDAPNQGGGTPVIPSNTCATISST